MFALQLFLMAAVLALFCTAGVLVAYDVYMATRLRCLLQRTGHAPVKSEEIGEAARTASQEHRPIPLRVARIASLEGGMIMSRKPSTAALDSFGHRLFPIRRRAPRHPAGETTTPTFDHAAGKPLRFTRPGRNLSRPGREPRRKAPKLIGLSRLAFTATRSGRPGAFYPEAPEETLSSLCRQTAKWTWKSLPPFSDQNQC